MHRAAASRRQRTRGIRSLSFGASNRSTSCSLAAERTCQQGYKRCGIQENISPAGDLGRPTPLEALLLSKATGMIAGARQREGKLQMLQPYLAPRFRRPRRSAQLPQLLPGLLLLLSAALLLAALLPPCQAKQSRQAKLRQEEERLIGDYTPQYCLSTRMTLHHRAPSN